MGAQRVLGAGVTREERSKQTNEKNNNNKNQPTKKKKKKRNQPTEKKTKNNHKEPAAPKEPEVTKQKKTTKTKSLTKPNKPKTSLEPDLNVLTLTATTPNKNPSRGQRSLGRADLTQAPGCGAKPPRARARGQRRKKRMCQPPSPSPQPWASEGRAQPGADRVGPEPPTKYSFPEGERERA